jgi:hypothetical protein
MASLDEAFNGRRMDNNEPIDSDRISIDNNGPIDELPSENELQRTRLNRYQDNELLSIANSFASQPNVVTPSQQLELMRNESPSPRTRRSRTYPNTRVTQEVALDRHICPELRQNLHNNTISGLDRPLVRNGFGGVGEIHIEQPFSETNNNIIWGVDRPIERNGFGGVNVEQPNSDLILPHRENLTRIAYYEDEYPVPNPNSMERKTNKILEAAEKRRSEPKKEGFFKKLFKKGPIPEPKETDLKKLFGKLKKEHSVVSEKLNKLEISLAENKELLEKSKTKFKDLIDITEDQELIDILNKKMNSNPLIELNENLKKEIDELAKEYTILKENCDSLAAVCPKNLCGVCFNSEVESFNYCGHAFCNDCISKIKKCDRCNEDIRNTKKIFYS